MRNPFRPSFGASPYFLAGRSQLIRDFQLSLMEGPGSPNRALLISGVRGVGKTVLLNELEDTARTQGWTTLRCYPRAEMIDELINTTIPEAISTLDPQKKRTVSGGTIAGIGGFRTEDNPHHIESTPTVITRLRELAEHSTGILITLDELQAAQPDPLHELATAVQDLIRDEFEIAIACAGLPHGVEKLLQHEGTTFMRRATRVDLHTVADEDVAETLNTTITDGGKTIAPAALEHATRLCKGYPYLIQVVGSLAWAQAALEGSESITEQHVHAIEADAIGRMMGQVHRPALTQVPDGEIDFLRAMASYGGEDVPTAHIASTLETTPNGISARRQRLIKRDLIESSGFGSVRFTLPYLDQYIREHP